MPLVSTCSAAISAACHAPPQDIDAYCLPVQWGVISPEGEIPARCAFTTFKDVRPPDRGEELWSLVEPTDQANFMVRLWRRLPKTAKSPLKSRKA